MTTIRNLVLLMLILKTILVNAQELPDSVKLKALDTLTVIKPVSDNASDEVQKSKITPGVPSKFDWIKLLDGTEMEVEVRRISEKYVFYSQPGDMGTDQVDRREVQTIYYRSGGVERMNTRATEIKAVNDWRSIEVTKNSEDVMGYIKIDDIEVRFEAVSRNHFRDAQALERSALTVARKQAALLNAEVVLITKVNHVRGYGEPPTIILTGEAYKTR
jgi:hypothetical protein